MSQLITAVSDQDFAQQVRTASNSQPVLVDFWAEWCGPCRMVAPVLEQLAAEQGGRLKIVKLNVDDNPQTAAAYGVRSIPTLILFKDGAPAASHVGAAPKARLAAFVTPHLAVSA
ncbi:thioredoxin [Solimonas aquatica]|uniref:Thioredoxin n=1 Tax=Solimonas aquatica TaxID=489703 RepID=A0A1H9BNC4_9GAMM|nr:thioredoxin [Solimonas aquatica]SEP90379.1 thioredoxin [Solimonas aquatica]